MEGRTARCGIYYIIEGYRTAGDRILNLWKNADLTPLRAS